MFQELMYEPRLLDCQQKVPAPSLVKGAVIVPVIGLQVEPPPPGVGVRVNVGVGPVPGVEVRVGGGTGVLVGLVPLLMAAEKLLTSRATPPLHGSKPICMLVRYHEVLPKPEPRVIASRMKGFTSALKLE